MRAHLKIKVVTLAAEARLIRRDEQRCLRQERRRLARNPDGKSYSHYTALWSSLREHRLSVVRPEARAAHLALAFLRGHQYAAVEGPTTRSTPPKTRVLEIVKKFGTGDRKELERTLEAWWDGGEALAAAA